MMMLVSKLILLMGMFGTMLMGGSLMLSGEREQEILPEKHKSGCKGDQPEGFKSKGLIGVDGDKSKAAAELSSGMQGMI